MFFDFLGTSAAVCLFLRSKTSYNNKRTQLARRVFYGVNLIAFIENLTFTK